MKARGCWMLMGLAAAVGLAAAESTAVEPDRKTPATSPRPTLGAIRWDAWVEHSPYQKNLAPKRWHDRLPFYARVISDTQVEVRADSQEVMDREIAYAKAAGLDYWAFLYYHVPWGKTTGFTHESMNRCRKLYLASKHKADVNFSVLIYPSAGEHWDRLVDDMAKLVKEPSYQKVAGGRPLIYLLAWGQESMPNVACGSWEKARSAIGSLRQRIIQAGLPSPYIVAQCMSPAQGAACVDKLGLDAISSYANWCGGSNYGDLAAVNRRYWQSCKATGKKVVPLLSAGWDPRPRNQAGGPEPSPAQLGDHVRCTLDWVRQHKDVADAQTIITYAWNESDEGGWLVPTRGEGTARLDAIRDALRGGEDQALRRRGVRLQLLCGSLRLRELSFADSGYGAVVTKGAKWPGLNHRVYHCRTDPKEVRVELTVPKGAAGKVRVFIVDPDACRKQTVSVGSVTFGPFERFNKGQWIEHPVAAGEAADGKVIVRCTNLNEEANAVVSIIEWVVSPPSSLPKPGADR